MESNLIFWPVLVQVTLTLVVFLLLAVRKAAALKAGGVDRSKTALHAQAWPDSVLKVSNNLRNQSETPVLFYVLSFVLWGLDAVSAITLGLAWIYAGTRVLHAFVHTGSNDLRFRMPVFLVSFVALVGLVAMTTGAMLTR